VYFGKPQKRPFAGLKQMHLDLPAVFFADFSNDQFQRFAARYQRHDTMMLGAESLRELTDRRPFPSGKAFQMQKQQVLQWGNAALLGFLSGKALKLPYPIM
jgi:hypothetical protein